MLKAVCRGSLCLPLIVILLSGCSVTPIGGAAANLTGNWSFSAQGSGTAGSIITLNAGLRGTYGDAINAMLAAAAMNFHKLLRAFGSISCTACWPSGANSSSS